MSQPIQTAVTISLVPQAKGGPFVFWDDLAQGMAQAAALGFDAVELFAPGPDAVPPEALRKQLTDLRLQLAAVGTGAGWVGHKWTLTDPDAGIRKKAADFIRSMIDFGGANQAPAIIGSMQGRWGGSVDKATARGWLGEAIVDLGEHASQYNVPLLYEPLNRYETNLCNTQGDGVLLLEEFGATNTRLLADLFHDRFQPGIMINPFLFDPLKALLIALEPLGDRLEQLRQFLAGGRFRLLEALVGALEERLLRLAEQFVAERIAIPESCHGVSSQYDAE